MANSENRQASALILPIFCQFRCRLFGGLLALLTVDLLQLSIPNYLKIGIDELTAGHSSSQRLLLLAGWIAATAAAAGVLRYAWRILLIGFSRQLENIVRDRLFSHLMAMDQAFHDRHSAGEIMAHAVNDLNAVQLACGMGLGAAIDAVLMPAAALLFMLGISPRLTLIAVAPLPLLGLSTWLLSRELHKRFEQVQAQFGLLTEFARNTLISVRLIKGCTREEAQNSKFEQLGKDYAAANVRAALLQGLLQPVSALIGSMGMLLVLHVGGRMVVSRAITPGAFIAFSSYLAMLIWPLSSIGWIIAMLRRGLTSLTRIERLLREESLLAGSILPAAEEQPVRILQSRPHISLRRLTFAYPGTAVPALEGIDLEIGPGLLGIAGKTGSGKSTLCRLLVRQQPLADGMFLFAGYEANQLEPALIRSRISRVEQSPVLFSGTAAENISLARPDASLEEIRDAAKTAGIDWEIMAMSEGYQTVIGERGLRLSGGQKQRMAIARALLAGRPILILDDALSALDAATGQQVFAALAQRQQGKTLIVVSHNLHFLARADQIVILDQGRIVAQGRHEQLLAGNPFYQALAAKQQEQSHEQVQLG